MPKNEKYLVAQIGKTVGLKGDLRLHIHTDFPDQFRSGVSYDTQIGKLYISSYNPKRQLVRFEGYDTIEKAKALTNLKMFATKEQTELLCSLGEGEYFWHEIVGAKVLEDGFEIGSVIEIERMAEVDYLVVLTDSSLVSRGFSKRFLIPYIDRYIVRFDKQEKIIYAKDAREILEAS